MRRDVYGVGACRLRRRLFRPVQGRLAGRQFDARGADAGRTGAGAVVANSNERTFSCFWQGIHVADGLMTKNSPCTPWGNTPNLP